MMHTTLPSLPDCWGWVHMPVIGYCKAQLHAQHPWDSGKGCVFNIDMFDSVDVETARRIVQSGNGSATISVPRIGEKLDYGKARLHCVETVPQYLRGIIPMSDFHAGDHLPPSNLYSAEARKMMDEEARTTLAEEINRLNAAGMRWVNEPTLTVMYSPTNQEEASGVYLFSVTLVDLAGYVQIDTKVTAKSEESAKLKAGVYGWLDREGKTLDDVTVLVKCLGIVKVGPNG